MNRLVSRALVAATVVAGSGAFVLLAAQPPQQKPPDPQRPVFRAGAYFVTVDVYPLQDGRVVDGLTAEDFQILEFQRSERLRVEWPMTGALDRREARLLDRAGQPLPIPLTLTETQSVTGPALAVDLTLAPLAVSDYVIELVAEAGGKTDRKLFAFRVGR